MVLKENLVLVVILLVVLVNKFCSVDPRSNGPAINGIPPLIYANS